MFEVNYGSRTIEYAIEKKSGLKSHYISVDKNHGVVLKGEAVDEETAKKLILKKARWIINKQALVQAIGVDDIVTGSRLPYLGRKYYTEVFVDESHDRVTVEFNESKFKFTVPSKDIDQTILRETLGEFYREKAKEKIIPRLKKWSSKTGFGYNELKFQFLQKRWGSCTPSNNIVINIDAIKLPFTLIDYLLVHELVHTVEKNHSKKFWALLSKHMPDYQELDKKMFGVKM